MHPSEEIRGTKSILLKNKRIVLGVTGSIAAVETIKLARELIRHSADVIPVMTPAATRIIHPDALWFATGKKPIIELTGETEHVSYCGNIKDHVDLLLISPCTANTISKIVNGIDDTAVTTFATTAIGAKHNILIVPAMHRSMYDHPLIQKNISIMKKNNIDIIDPYFEKNNIKIASLSDICARVIRLLSNKTLDNKKILIIGGSCCEPVDAVRSFCNLSSGKSTVAFAKQAFYLGAKVEIWYGESPESIPTFLAVKRYRTVDDIKNFISKTNLNRFDIIVVCAALSDYIPDKIKGKISSDNEILTLTCKKADKILSIIRKKADNAILIGFKLEIDKKNLLKKAQNLRKQYMLDYVIANTTKSFDKKDTEAWIIKDSKVIHIKDTKENLALTLFNDLESIWK